MMLCDYRRGRLCSEWAFPGLSRYAVTMVLSVCSRHYSRALSAASVFNAAFRVAGIGCWLTCRETNHDEL